MDARDGMAELSGMACNQAWMCPWAQTDMGMDVHTFLGDTGTKAQEAAAVPSQGVTAHGYSCITGPLPPSLG